MTSKTNADFWACYDALPKEIQRLARKRFQLWQEDAFNTARHFKPLIDDVWSIRVNQGYRALGRRRGNLIVWFWIGTHTEYDYLLKRL